MQSNACAKRKQKYYFQKEQKTVSNFKTTKSLQVGIIKNERQ